MESSGVHVTLGGVFGGVGVGLGQPVTPAVAVGPVTDFAADVRASTGPTRTYQPLPSDEYEDRTPQGETKAKVDRAFIDFKIALGHELIRQGRLLPIEGGSFRAEVSAATGQAWFWHVRDGDETPKEVVDITTIANEGFVRALDAHCEASGVRKAVFERGFFVSTTGHHGFSLSADTRSKIPKDIDGYAGVLSQLLPVGAPSTQGREALEKMAHLQLVLEEVVGTIRDKLATPGVSSRDKVILKARLKQFQSSDAFAVLCALSGQQADPRLLKRDLVEKFRLLFSTDERSFFKRLIPNPSARVLYSQFHDYAARAAGLVCPDRAAYNAYVAAEEMCPVTGPHIEPFLLKFVQNPTGRDLDPLWDGLSRDTQAAMQAALTRADRRRRVVARALTEAAEIAPRHAVTAQVEYKAYAKAIKAAIAESLRPSAPPVAAAAPTPVRDLLAQPPVAPPRDAPSPGLPPAAAGVDVPPLRPVPPIPPPPLPVPEERIPPVPPSPLPIRPDSPRPRPESPLLPPPPPPRRGAIPPVPSPRRLTPGARPPGTDPHVEVMTSSDSDEG